MMGEDLKVHEGSFGLLVGKDSKVGYEHRLYGEITKVDGTWLEFDTTGEEKVRFYFNRIKSFTPTIRRHRLPKLPRRHLKRRKL